VQALAAIPHTKFKQQAAKLGLVIDKDGKKTKLLLCARTEVNI
jgi:hypothetical protein